MRLRIPTLVLGIESSCDEMAAAVVRGGHEIVASVVRHQAALHGPYGGVVPELASRDHVRVVSQVVAETLASAGFSPGDLGGVAVTTGPGLVGSLLVGVSFAKALAYRHRLPLVGVHHVAGHLASAEIADERLEPPYLGMVVSGGHTALYRVVAEGPPSLLGETRDDAVGEAFDKVAKLLGLGYPGGPALAAIAAEGDAGAVRFPRPMESDPGLDFSFSGLKTAVALEVERRGRLTARNVADLAASFEAAATDVLVAKARRALVREGLGRLAVVGGVAANRRLRHRIDAASRDERFLSVFPPPELCTDNAAMIAAAGARRLAHGERDGFALGVFSRAPVGSTPGRMDPPS